MFDEEAEEEEEEGAQAGLGDFGFGRHTDITDRIDETVCASIVIIVRGIFRLLFSHFVERAPAAQGRVGSHCRCPVRR